MKKLLALLLALLLCFATLVACYTPEESSSSSSSEEQSTSTEGPTLEESISSSKEPAEIVYYDEIEEFTLKDDAPEFKLCKSYNDLLAVLEAPLQNFDGNLFEDNYILMLRGVSFSGASGYVGFTNVISSSGSPQILGQGSFELLEGTAAIEWHLQNINGCDYPAVISYTDALIVIPKENISPYCSNIIVFNKCIGVDDESEITKQFH